MVLVSRTGPAIVAGNLPYPPMAIMTSRDRVGLSGVNPAESARQRLIRALRYLHELGLQAAGDIEPGQAYQAAHREAGTGRYGRVFLLLGNGSSWRNRIAACVMAARLRVSANMPVDAPRPAS
jgi:hypothetical protein